MPEPDALARALDEAGHVRDDELPPVGGLDRPEHGRERRERVLGDLRPRVRDAGEERRLAGVRETDERGVGEELEAQLDLLLLAGQADLGVARRLPGRAGEVLVAAAARPACGDDDASARAREVGDELLSRRRPASRREPRARRRRHARRARGFRRRSPPRSARTFWFGRKPERSRRRRSATSTTSPPSPPSPPSGPPRGTNFSRRKWIEPSPPRPATTISRARSWNMAELVAVDDAR